MSTADRDGFIIAGASLRHLPAMDDGIFNPDLYLERLERSIIESVPAPVAVIVSFPSNPVAVINDMVDVFLPKGTSESQKKVLKDVWGGYQLPFHHGVSSTTNSSPNSFEYCDLLTTLIESLEEILNIFLNGLKRGVHLKPCGDRGIHGQP